MKRSIILIICVTVFGMAALSIFDSSSVFQSSAQTTQTTTIPDVIKLDNAKLGPVTFNHADHFTKNYNKAGDGPIACVECHHTAQPAAEVAKNPLWKTAFPADRTTTLTKELFTKDPAAANAASCRGCHARTGETPKLLPKIPEIKIGDATVNVNNMQAFHRKCAACHTEVMKLRPTAKAPTATQCALCHKKAA